MLSLQEVGDNKPRHASANDSYFVALSVTHLPTSLDELFTLVFGPAHCYACNSTFASHILFLIHVIIVPSTGIFSKITPVSQ
jgi:hypothetical protein